MIKKMRVVVALVAAAALFTVSAGATTTKVVTIAMHDPGCHSFSVHGHFSTRFATQGPVLLRNDDETTIIVRSHTLSGAFGMRTLAVGRTLALAHGTYGVTMQGQAIDDNHLTLVVR